MTTEAKYAARNGRVGAGADPINLRRVLCRMQRRFVVGCGVGIASLAMLSARCHGH